MKYIIEFIDEGERNYICRYDADYKITQTSKSYSAGVIEFDTMDEAEKVAKKLRHDSGALLSKLNKGATVIQVH